MKTRFRKQRGTSMLEFAMIFPVLFFFLVGVFDMGFFWYSLIAVQNAARVAALYTSSSATNQANSAGACAYVLKELQNMPNYASLPAACSAAPLQVTAAAKTASDGTAASVVTVTYRTLQLVPIPGLASILTITRAVQMRVRG